MRFMKITQNAITVATESPLNRNHCACEAASASARGRVPPSCGSRDLLIICATAPFAQNAENIADREVQRRQAAIPAGEAALARGKSAMRSRNYTVAYQEFKTAIAYLPDAVVSGRAHDEAADGVCKSGTVLGRSAYRAGRLRRGGSDPE